VLHARKPVVNRHLCYTYTLISVVNIVETAQLSPIHTERVYVRLRPSRDARRRT